MRYQCFEHKIGPQEQILGALFLPNVGEMLGLKFKPVIFPHFPRWFLSELGSNLNNSDVDDNILVFKI